MSSPKITGIIAQVIILLVCCTILAPNVWAGHIAITIDPGHGGHDPGTSHGRYIKEKNIVLSIGKKLQQAINRLDGFQAQMTRHRDQYVGLRQRLNIARAQSADLMISIHADANNSPHAQGISIYALSDKGATSEAARWLAEKENHAMLGGAKLNEQSDTLKSVLIDLQQNASIKQALDVGKSIRSSMGKVAKLHQKHIEQAAFVVLKSPDIPSLLIETGFLSNRLEAKRLANTKYQQRLANSIASGILQYYKAHPIGRRPYHAHVLLHKHTVQKGQTLYSIAKQYDITVYKLARDNAINIHGKISIGQQLIIN